ncbi:MAG: hypothetical protein MK110_05170 [Fuerstiella sp.]|nr:hypothetical protein [Fuerstiella sp.]
MEICSSAELPGYDRHQSYEWNYERAPSPVSLEVPAVQGKWSLCGLPVDSPLGIPAGPLLNGRWCLYYASLGFDVVTYKTVRSRARECYVMPNLQPVKCDQVSEHITELPASSTMNGSWAVSYGMPSMEPDVWRKDVQATRTALPPGKLLSVSVVATVQEGWTIDDIAEDYALCARWAVESGADIVETNFSCPNVSTRDGQLYQNPDAAQQVADCVRSAIGQTPYIVKIGHVPSHAAAADLLDALRTSTSAIAMTNSVATQVRDGSHLLFDGQRRGICGQAILDASVDQVAMFHQLVVERRSDMELIGVGGISSAADVQRYLSSGASACHLATAAMTNPGIALQIRSSLQPAG